MMFFLETVVATTPEWFEYLKPLLEAVVPVVASALGIFLTLMFKRLLDQWQKKTGVELDEKHQEKIRQSILGGIALAEQETLRKLKLKEDAPDSAKKLQISVQYVKETLKEMGYSKVSESQIKQWVEMLLAQTSGPAVVSAEDPESAAIARISSIPLPPAGTQFFLNGGSASSS
jgi:hypothetical protein